jgi:hypothetical protein
MQLAEIFQDRSLKAHYHSGPLLSNKAFRRTYHMRLVVWQRVRWIRTRSHILTFGLFDMYRVLRRAYVDPSTTLSIAISAVLVSL